MDTLPDPVFVKDAEGRYLATNAAHTRALGLASPDQVVGKTALDLFPEEVTTRSFYADDQQVLLSGEPLISREQMVPDPDGQERWFLTSKVPLRDDSGTVVGLVGVGRDVTERKRAEEALRESEQRYRAQFNEALDAIYIADAETGILIDCNRAAGELVARGKSDLIGKHQRILHPPEELTGELSRGFRQHLGEKEGQSLDAQVLTSSGEIRDVSIKANLLEIGGRKILQGIFRDITARKRAEEALRESEELYRTLVETSPDAMTLSGLDATVRMCNQQAAALLGFDTVEEVIGKPSIDFIAPEDHQRAWANARRTLQEGTVRDVEYTFLTRDGSRFPGELSASLILDADGKPKAFMALTRDITERKRAEEALRESEERYRAIFEQAPDSVVVVDAATGALVEYNDRAHNALGYTREEFQEISIPDFEIIESAGG